MATPSVFGKKLKELRDKRGWSQPRLAEAAGMSRGYIGGIESGIRGRNPSRDVILRLAEALGESPYELLEAAGRLESTDKPGGKARPTFRQVVMGDPLLRKDEREMLLGLYETFTKGRRR